MDRVWPLQQEQQQQQVQQQSRHCRVTKCFHPLLHLRLLSTPPWLSHFFRLLTFLKFPDVTCGASINDVTYIFEIILKTSFLSHTIRLCILEFRIFYNTVPTLVCLFMCQVKVNCINFFSNTKYAIEGNPNVEILTIYLLTN